MQKILAVMDPFFKRDSLRQYASFWYVTHILRQVMYHRDEKLISYCPAAFMDSIIQFGALLIASNDQRIRTLQLSHFCTMAIVQTSL